MYMNIIYTYMYINIFMRVSIYIQGIYIYVCEQSRKLQVHGKDIRKFGKVPSLATRLHKNDVWQTWRHRLKENYVHDTPFQEGIDIWTGPIAQLESHKFQNPMSVLFMLSMHDPLTINQLRVGKRCFHTDQWANRVFRYGSKSLVHW